MIFSSSGVFINNLTLIVMWFNLNRFLKLGTQVMLQNRHAKAADWQEQRLYLLSRGKKGWSYVFCVLCIDVGLPLRTLLFHTSVSVWRGGTVNTHHVQIMSRQACDLSQTSQEAISYKKQTQSQQNRRFVRERRGIKKRRGLWKRGIMWLLFPTLLSLHFFSH